MTRFACYFSDYPTNVTYLWATGPKAALRKFAQMKGYKWITGNMKVVKV